MNFIGVLESFFANNVVGISSLGIIVLVGIYYLFFSDKTIEHHAYEVISDSGDLKPKYYIHISSSTKNEFVVGQKIHINAHLLFTNDEAYKEFIETSPDINGESINFITGMVSPFKKESVFFETNNKSLGKLVIIISDASSLVGDNWFLSPVILMSQTDDLLRKELKTDFVSNSHLKGEADLVFHNAGVHDIYTFSNGKKLPISTINISPRTVGHEFKRHKWAFFIALIGLGLAFLSLFIKQC